MKKILYIGNSNPNTTSFHRAKALERLGHTVIIKDPYDTFSQKINSKWLGPIHFRTGYRLLQSEIVKWLKEIRDISFIPDLIWVNGGELLGANCLKVLKNAGCPIVLYNNDDPTGGRDGRRFDSLFQALPHYNLCVVMRKINVEEFKNRGAKRVLQVTMSYDEISHQPFGSTSEISEIFRSEVAFIGTWMRNENRDKFLIDLIHQKVPVSIWGNRWQKSPLWKDLQSAYRGSALTGRDYVAAIQNSKVCIGMLSKGNRDLHTQRSLEIPFIGGLLCAERTSEHMGMYMEGVDAVFWDDSTECAKICKDLLSNDDLRESIRLSGMRKVRSLLVGNENICQMILQKIEDDIQIEN